MGSLYLFAVLLIGAAAGCVGVAIAHYFHEYVRSKGWRGWHVDG